MRDPMVALRYASASSTIRLPLLLEGPRKGSPGLDGGGVDDGE